MNAPDIDRLVAVASPWSADAVAALPLAEAEAELAERITRSPRAARRPRRRALRVLGVGVAALALTGAGWATLTARTGLFGRGAGFEEGAGEVIRLDAPDAEVVVDRIARHIVLPPGGSFERWKADNLRPAVGGGRPVGVTMTESGIESSLSEVAACEWTGHWLDGHARGDRAQMAAAQQVLDQIPSWPAIVGNDGDGGVVTFLRRRAEGARAGDPSRFIDEYTVNCTDVPLTGRG
jgi:hypothetical protein